MFAPRLSVTQPDRDSQIPSSGRYPGFCGRCCVSPAKCVALQQHSLRDRNGILHCRLGTDRGDCWLSSLDAGFLSGQVRVPLFATLLVVHPCLFGPERAWRPATLLHHEKRRKGLYCCPRLVLVWGLHMSAPHFMSSARKRSSGSSNVR